MRTHQRVKLTIWIIFLLGLTVLYPYLLNTDQPFVAKWRALYIETAMSTMTHQWLATSIIPQDIIDEVMTTREEIFNDQADVESIWQAGEHKTAVEVAEEQVDVKETFYTLFSELDRDSMEAFLEKNPDYLKNGYMNINIDWCTKGQNTGIKTTAGDHVMAVNAAHSLMILEVDGNLYNGRLAIVKDSSRVDLGTCKRLFTGSGMRAPEMADYNDAILLTNASGFVDAEGAGNQYNSCLASNGFTGHSPIVFVTYHNAGGTELLNGIHIPFLIQICTAILRRGLISHDPIEDHGHFCPCQRIVRAEFPLLANDYAHGCPALNGILGPMIGNICKGDGGSIVGGRGRLVGEHG